MECKGEELNKGARERLKGKKGAMSEIAAVLEKAFIFLCAECGALCFAFLPR